LEELEMEEFRFIILCDRNGVKTDPKLQYWDTVYDEWIDVPLFEIKNIIK